MDVINEDERLAQRIKKLDPERFHTLCRMHLSFLLDLTSEDLLAICDNKTRNSSNRKPTFTASLHRKFKVPVDETANTTLTQAEVNSLNELIHFLGHDHNICQEGLFRKSGKKSRQHNLRHLLSSGVPLQLEGNLYNAHDCASVLKGVLADLPEPLLTESHFIAHCQIASLCNNSAERSRDEMIRGRQIQALQLLFLLLPNKNRNLLRNLLMLLHRVSQENQRNRMNAANLATMFAPHILCPKKMSAEEFYLKSPVMTKAVALMIENSPELFKIPLPLAADLRTYWENKMGIGQQNKGQLEWPVSFDQEGPLDTTAVQTVVTFCDRQKSETDSNYNTAAALAELYSHIQSMPESAKKKQLIKQFHKENSIESPLHSQSVVKHRRSKSLRKSIKKHLFGGHQRHRTSQFYMQKNAAREDDSSCVVLENCYMNKTDCSHNRTQASGQSEALRSSNKLNSELETIRHPAYCLRSKLEKPSLRASASTSYIQAHCTRSLSCLSKSTRGLSLVASKCTTKSMSTLGCIFPSKRETSVTLVAFRASRSASEYSLLDCERPKCIKASLSMTVIHRVNRHIEIFRETAV